MNKVLQVVALIVLWSISYAGFSQTGNLEGSLWDDRGPIPGTILSLQNEQTFKAQSDLEGRFLFANIPSGNYTLKIDTYGYNEYVQTLTVQGQQTVNLGKILLSQGKQEKDVTVSFFAKVSEQKAINLVKTSPSVVTIVSADIIAKLPNKNASDVVARVPGASLTRNKGEGSNISLRGTPIDWTATFLNGDRLPVADEENPTRSFEFEILPADMIEYVFVAKSTTPDMESDQIGGCIDFISRSSVAKKTFKLNLAGGYNALAQKPLGTLNFLWGNRSKNNKWSFLVNGTNYGRYYAADAFKMIYGSNFNHSLNRYELRKYEGTRINNAANIALEFKPSNHFKIGTHAMYSFMQDDKYQKRQSYNWYEGSGQRIRLQNIHGKLNRQLFGGDIYSEWKITPALTLFTKVAHYDNQFWYGNVPYAKKDPRNGYFINEFISPLLQFSDQSYVSLYGGTIDPNDPGGFPAKLIGPDDPYGQGDDPNNIQPQYATIFGGQALRADDFEYYRSYTEINKTKERDLAVAQTNLTYEVQPNLKLKVGTKMRQKEGSRSISKHEWFKDYSIPGNNNPFMLMDFQQEEFSTHPSGFLAPLGANYEGQLYPFQDRQAISSFLIDSSYLLREMPMTPLNQEYYQWVGSNYSYSEFQSGTYLMADCKINKLSIVGGFRYEYTRFKEVSDTLTDAIAFDSISGSQYNIPERRSVSRSYAFLLPSLNLTYRMNDKVNFRLAFSEGMKRPNFEQTKPGFAMIRYTDLVYIFGNPNLKPTYAFNYDAAFEYFWPGKGMFSVALFYKDVHDHIFTVTTADIDPFSGIMVKKYENASRSKVYGLELNLIRKFDFLPGFLSGFGTNSNLTISDSRMNIPGRPVAQKMTEQTPLVFNFGLIYEYKKWTGRAAFNYIGKQLKEVNLASIVGIGLMHIDDDFDTYSNAMTNLDVQISYQLTPKMSLYAEGMNMLNSPERKYIGKEWRHLRMEYYGIRGQVGFRLEL
jgi:outer membrane receptor protein involved in Fe transport